MKYFIDTEFLEGPQKERFPISLFRKNTPPTIDLISIGIVAEDGREYYAISKDFNLKEAWNRFDWKTDGPLPDVKHRQKGMSSTLAEEAIYRAIPKKVYWLRENVLRPIFDELFSKSLQNDNNFVKNNFFTAYSGFSYGHLKALINYYGQTNKKIAEEIENFTQVAVTKECKNGSLIIGATEDMQPIRANFVWDNPEFYAYYADYDWVVFCWLFGKMMDLPSNFPMYCRDLKQVLDERQKELSDIERIRFKYIGKIKNHPNFPKQDPSKSHNAIEDARWNKKLYEFLKQL